MDESLKIRKYEPDRVERKGVCLWVVYKVTLEDGYDYEYWASANSETESMLKSLVTA